MEEKPKVIVQPVRTFQWGPEVKTPGSEPFEVEQHQAAELRAVGLVAQEGGEKVAQEHSNKMAADPSNKRAGAPKKNAGGRSQSTEE